MSEIAKTFGRQWGRFDVETQRTWGTSGPDRRRQFLVDVDFGADWFPGKSVLDAGCGPGDFANAVAELGCDVTGMDISSSVHAAQRRFPRVRFVQGDLADPPLPAESFDVVYSGGVLHHSPSTRAALGGTCSLVKPGGRMYVWLYWAVPGASYRARKALRQVLGPLPVGAKDAVCVPLAAQAALFDRSLTFREHLLAQRDFYTPKWRWEHTPEEVIGWLDELGFDARLKSTSRDGFGVLADKRRWPER
jgi:2-polyprenyl-3-methyl-5-hydroxy-6-metoxy-1,4-benzoquinol methylase